MKKFFYHTLIIFMALLACACSDFDQVALWNKTNDMNSRIITLEELCKEMNTNIESIKTILAAQQEGDCITNVSPIYENGVEIGYVITFKKNGTVSIYHGKNGTNGTDGKDGLDGINGTDGDTPQISVKLDEDGNYYWTLNGEWLLDASGNKIKAQGTDGKDGINGSDGSDGTNGSDGKDGADGKDGITPSLKIENGCWYLSLDNGESWSNLGAAVGADGKDGQDGKDGADGKDGQDGKDGDSFFSEVNTDNPDYVVITLVNGTVITIPTWTAFESLKSYCESLNNNILALQTIVNALQDKDYVTSVTPLKNEGVEIGYVITFSKSGSITIYHGKDGTNGSDGKPGADGKDGISPQIGVRQDTDGIFYWTLNEEWLTDASGNKIKAQGTDGKDGADGKPGNDGADGKDGADAIAPQLKIENDYWFISVDGGSTWTKLGPSRGENGKDGINGSNGKDGDALFSNIDYTTSYEYVSFILADGTVIKLPTWAAFETLRTLCMQMNKNISSLHTIVEALQNGDYVKSITPIYENGKEIGYTILFSKSGAVTIYHGRDGKDGNDGADGKDGNTPEIGVRQDSDGIFYWTLNGEWLTDATGYKIKAQGTDGKDGADGNPGNDGADGADGKDGITPLLKIEDGDWLLSTDNGNTWQNLGRATGEDGKDGTSGDSTFSDVDFSSSSEYVIFTLADGTVIKLPTWSAFEALRTLCNKMNTNISSLQALIEALQNNDYIKATVPVVEDGKEVGYTIIFAKSNPITIYHGKDGANGADGKDGASPAIGIAKYNDGIYYWTLNGEWLTDASGTKIKAQGTDGKDGNDGADGADGKDAIAPKLKIENGYWYLSVDGGKTWSQQGKATGEDGTDGADGKDGDSIFQSVTQDEDNVYFTLADGTIITIPKNASSTPAGLTIKIYDGDTLLGTTFNTYLFHVRTLTYKVEGASGDVAIDFRYEADKYWTIEHTKTGSNTGTIKISAGNDYAQKTATITLQASCSNSTSAMAKLLVTWDRYNP